MTGTGMTDTGTANTGTANTGTVGPGWLRDPTRAHELRYWNGVDWTEHVSDQGLAGQDPLTTELPPPDGAVTGT